MIISVYSPHTNKNGNTVTTLLTGLGLADLKRKVFLTHITPISYSFEMYLGLKAYDDKTTTPSQLVKLMMEGAIKTEEIGDYCKNVYDYLDVFTNTNTNFTEDDMATLLNYVLNSTTDYEYFLFDINENSSKATDMVLNKSDVIILNLSQSFIELDEFNRMKEDIVKKCKGKKVIVVCNQYEQKVGKIKDINKKLGIKTNIYPIRRNHWLRWATNEGKLVYFYRQGKGKRADVMEVYKDATSIASALTKLKVSLAKKAKGVKK